MDSYWKLGDKVFVQGKIVEITDSVQDGITYTVKFERAPNSMMGSVMLKGEDITEKVGACEG